MKDVFIVSSGAVLGANIRFLIYKKLDKYNFNKNLFVITVNTFSCFLLGLFFSFLPRIAIFNFTSQLILFLSIGFFGSLSTFSSFVYDLFELYLQLKFFKALYLFFISLSFGIIALAFGLLVGNQ